MNFHNCWHASEYLALQALILDLKNLSRQYPSLKTSYKISRKPLRRLMWVKMMIKFHLPHHKILQLLARLWALSFTSFMNPLSIISSGLVKGLWNEILFPHLFLWAEWLLCARQNFQRIRRTYKFCSAVHIEGISTKLSQLLALRNLWSICIHPDSTVYSKLSLISLLY